MSEFRKMPPCAIRQISLNLIFALVIGGAGANFLQAQTDAEKLRNAAITPETLSASFAVVARQVEAAVVNIDAKGKVPPEITLKDDKPNSSNLDEVPENMRRQASRRPSYAVGSGFIVDKSGYILTNYHVVTEASRIVVQLSSGEEFVAKLVGADDETDLAILKIDAPRDLPFIKFGDSEQAQVGDWVLAIGSPFGLAQTVTAGIVSQTRRETPTGNAFQKFIQTDAAINRGNSGGPLVNMNGEVIGVNSQIATSTGDYNGIGFALPSNEAANVYRQIRQNGKVRRGYLGVILDSVKAEFAKVYGLPEAKGAIITEIRDKNSAAANAGLQAGDVILEFGGEKVLSAPDLITKVSAVTPQKEVGIVFLRENGSQLERKSIVLKLAERPSNNLIVEDDAAPQKLPVSNIKKPLEPFGLTLLEITPQLAAVFKVEGEKGLIIKSINPESFIADVKNSNGADALGEGDLIQRINRLPVTNLKSFSDAANSLKKGDAVVLHVQSYNPKQRKLELRIVQFTVQ